MKELNSVLIGILVAVLIIFAIKICSNSSEGWYPTGTYVNTPRTVGVYPTYTYNPYRGYYGYRNWGRPPRPVLANAGPNPGAPIPRGIPVPLDTIRWRGMFGPMLTSIKSPKDYAIGQWVRAGTAYTDNPNDYTYVDVYQLNLDPGRELFSYVAVTKNGQRIPIHLRQGHYRLEDGDRFKIQGMEGKGDFVFVEADKYTYVYV